MGQPTDTSDSRAQTNESLASERHRADDELLSRSVALAEDADELIARARERARAVLALAREREDHQLELAKASAAATTAVHDERDLADRALAMEHLSADANRLDERERRRLAIVAIIAHERQITDRTLASERNIADRNLEAREDMLALVAHDLRSMLSGILISASTVLLFKDLRQEVAGAAAMIQRASSQMAQLLEDLVDFSTFEAGELRLRLAQVDLVQVVRDALEVYEPVAATNGVALTLEAPPQPFLLRADGRRLTRLVANLVSNALKFTPQGGRVEVALSVIDGECELSVRDSGVGIAPHLLETIFDRFRQVGDEPRHSFGVGLGLYIARMITRAHGGRISVESSEGVGTTFRVRLPLVPPS